MGPGSGSADPSGHDYDDWDEPPSHVYQCPDCRQYEALCECGEDGPEHVLVPNPYREHGDETRRERE